LGVGTYDGIVVGGRLGGPIPGEAGAYGATVVMIDGAGTFCGLGGATGTPGDGGAEKGWCGGD
jgi:hypothetical protein